jgi:hypothetical protein
VSRLTALIAELGAAAPAPGYTTLDRYRDFRAVFLGSDQGKRVLHQILDLCHVFEPSIDPQAPIDPLMTHARDGERTAALAVLRILAEEPAARPSRANSKPPKGNE